MIKYYISSSFKNKEKVQNISKQLQQHNLQLTYDWTQNSRAISLEGLARIGQEELNAVRETEVFILLLPGGKGSHIELGIALGLNKKIFIFSPDHEIYNYATTSTFYHVKNVKHIIGSEELLIKEIIK